MHKTPKGFQKQLSTDLHTVQKNHHSSVYKVNGELYPRKERQLVKGNVVKLPEKSKQQQAVIVKQDKIGKAANNPAVKEQLNTKKPDYKVVQTMTDSKSKPTRITKKVVNMN